jgi:hypothetical protein
MSIKGAVKDTIDYAAKFGSCINKKEIEERLISKKHFSKEEIIEVIKNLSCKERKNSYYKEKIYKAEVLANKIGRKFKDILFLGISGSVASGHPKKNDDIDILVITKSNKLWMTRLWLRWWIYKNQIPHRKYGEGQKKNDFCFNLWLDENSLLLPKSKQNLKNAVDLILLKPLVNRNRVYERFITANSWAKKWVATPYVNKTKDLRLKEQGLKIRQNNFDKVMNHLYFWPQYWYMRGKIKKEKVSLYWAFFHQ